MSADGRPLSATYGLLLRLQASRGRLAAVGALGTLVVLVGVAVRISDPASPTAEVNALNRAGLALFVPVTALVFATAVLGEMVEDGTLVYVVGPAHPALRPGAGGVHGQPRGVTLPCVLVPMGIFALVLDPDPRLLVGALVASGLSALAHTALFVGLGARMPRALLWGLAYVAVWEGLVGAIGASLARTSLRLHANSLLRSIADAPAPEFAVAASTAVIVLALVTIAGVALTTLILDRADSPIGQPGGLLRRRPAPERPLKPALARSSATPSCRRRCRRDAGTVASEADGGTAVGSGIVQRDPAQGGGARRPRRRDGGARRGRGAPADPVDRLAHRRSLDRPAGQREPGRGRRGQPRHPVRRTRPLDGQRRPARRPGRRPRRTPRPADRWAHRRTATCWGSWVPTPP